MDAAALVSAKPGRTSAESIGASGCPAGAAVTSNHPDGSAVRSCTMTDLGPVGSPVRRHAVDNSGHGTPPTTRTASVPPEAVTENCQPCALPAASSVTDGVHTPVACAENAAA